MSKKNIILTSVLCSLVGWQALTAAHIQAADRPRLVVGIVVDQLRTDYLEYLQKMFGKKGFNRLMNDALYLRDVDFKVNRLDAASGTAMVFTGNYPAMNGITAAKVFHSKSKSLQPVLTDPEIIGNFTSSTFSPKGILLSTISDEIAVDGDGMAAIYSIAPDAQQAIIMAGHGGSSAFWIDENSGKWATTTYYKEVPQSISTRNYKQPLSSRLDTMVWRPSIPIANYQGIPQHKKDYEFRHTFPRSDREAYRMFSASPLANREVTDVAIDYLKNLRLGQRTEAIDMLNLGYTLAPYKYSQDSDYRLELQDAYLRLDSQLARLFDAIEDGPGLENTLVFLTSTGYFDDAAPENEKFGIPSGTLSIKRAQSLLNSYLSAKYGNADYVDGLVGTDLFLDHNVLEMKGLDPSAIIADAREFICKLSGVATAYTLKEILSAATPELEAMRLVTDPKRSGDIKIVPMPGWTVVDDLNFRNPDHHERISMVNAPAFILYPSVEKKVVSTPVEATAIAPTVSSALHIRAPNGALSKPIITD